MTRAKVEEAFDFLIDLEFQAGNSSSAYDMLCEKYKIKIKEHESAIRDYALKRQPQSLQKMQDDYYAFTNSDKYRASSISISVVTATLNEQWNGIGGWMI